MATRVWLGVVVAATALVIALGSRSDRAPQAAIRHRQPEAPWLTPEASTQIVGPHGQLGPLFADVAIGGPAPSQETLARIADFARTHDVTIAVEVADDTVQAVHFDVLFGGCCGYEGADVLARRLGRPTTSSCCGCTETWIDNWAIAAGDGVYVRASVQVNRVTLRWERELSTHELLDRADSLLGTPVPDTTNGHWRVLERGRRYHLCTPYAFESYRMQSSEYLGIDITAHEGRIVETAFSIRKDEDADRLVALQARWGRARGTDGHWTWSRRDRIITVEDRSPTMRVTIRSR